MGQWVQTGEDYMQILSTTTTIKFIWFPSYFDISAICLSEILVLGFIDEPSKSLALSDASSEYTLDENVREASATP
jgi:hypothetical protein